MFSWAHHSFSAQRDCGGYPDSHTLSKLMLPSALFWMRVLTKLLLHNSSMTMWLTAHPIIYHCKCLPCFLDKSNQHSLWRVIVRKLDVHCVYRSYKHLGTGHQIFLVLGIKVSWKGISSWFKLTITYYQTSETFVSFKHQLIYIY